MEPHDALALKPLLPMDCNQIVHRNCYHCSQRAIALRRGTTCH